MLELALKWMRQGSLTSAAAVETGFGLGAFYGLGGGLAPGLVVAKTAGVGG